MAQELSVLLLNIQMEAAGAPRSDDRAGKFHKSQDYGDANWSVI